MHCPGACIALTVLCVLHSVAQPYLQMLLLLLLLLLLTTLPTHAAVATAIAIADKWLYLDCTALRRCTAVM